MIVLYIIQNFYIENYKTNRLTLESVQSLKIYKVTDHINISQENAFEKISKSYVYWNKYTPIIKESKFIYDKIILKNVNKYYHENPINNININEQSISYRSTYYYNKEQKDIEQYIIWLTLGNFKLCINLSKDTATEIMKNNIQ